MVTLEQAKALTYGTILYDKTNKNADGTPARWKVNGKTKTWKRDPARVQVPLKHGLHDYGYLTDENMHFFTLVEEEAY